LQTNDYDSPNLKDISNSILFENIHSKAFGKCGNDEFFYSNKTTEVFDNLKFQEELIFKQLEQCEVDEKYAVNTVNLSHEQFGLFNFNHIKEKFLSKKLMKINKKEKIIEELKDNLFNILFKSKLNFYLYFLFLLKLKLNENLEKYDANHLWKNNFMYNNDSVIRFLRENCIVDNNLSNFQYIDLNKIYNLLMNQLLVKTISSYFKENKRFKIIFDSNGVDKFTNKKNMMKDFQVEIKYTFE